MLGIAASVIIFAQVGNPVVTPPQSPPIKVEQSITVQVPEPDPEATSQMASWSFSGIVVTLIAPTLAGWANNLLNVPDFYRSTPPDLTYDNDGVKAMADLVHTAALALMVLAILRWGIAALLQGGASLGSLIYGTALMLGNMLWWQWGIQLNNAICATIAAPPVATLVKPHLEVPKLTADPTEVFGPAVLVIVYAIVLILLMLAMFFRLGMVDILLVIGSLALFCKAGEQTEKFTESYVGMATGTLFSQILVVVALKLALILGVVAGGIAGTLLGIVCLLLARKMPGLLSSRLSQSSGGGLLKSIVLVRRLITRV